MSHLPHKGQLDGILWRFISNIWNTEHTFPQGISSYSGLSHSTPAITPHHWRPLPTVTIIHENNVYFIYSKLTEVLFLTLTGLGPFSKNEIFFVHNLMRSCISALDGIDIVTVKLKIKLAPFNLRQKHQEYIVIWTPQFTVLILFEWRIRLLSIYLSYWYWTVSVIHSKCNKPTGANIPCPFCVANWKSIGDKVPNVFSVIFKLGHVNALLAVHGTYYKFFPQEVKWKFHRFHIMTTPVNREHHTYEQSK